MKSFRLYSDGGGERMSAAAAACIIEEMESGRRVHIVAWLDGATNNESEISGGLLGFAFLKVLLETGEKASIEWICDSEYTLKSATQYIHQWQRNGWKTSTKAPVKNQGLWQAYLALSAGYDIRPAHVRGHSGHAENEECDAICTWVRGHGKESLEAEGEPCRIGAQQQWLLIDGAPVLEALRPDFPGDPLAYAVKLESLNIATFDGSLPPAPRDPLIPLRQKLQEALRTAEKLSKSEPGKTERARAVISELLKEL